ncbi:hypothetical protein SAMN05444920_11413 [Nonomuraea solani]|uniref:Uncharacterized protein n=1 Tax=Nonomuraea solani TaxID=1144553 RepID=A0A1H6EPH0_9ACTN|nr:hypothetical protein SAMN05444920_11413 [Nonomuraea solani]
MQDAQRLHPPGGDGRVQFHVVVAEAARRRLPAYGAESVHMGSIAACSAPGRQPACRFPVRATPKALCKTILDVYGDPHPGTLDDLVRSVRDSIRDHNTTALHPDSLAAHKILENP